MQRPIWKGHISFGLVNIPIVLYSAEHRAGLHFYLLDSRNRSRIHYARINDETGQEVPWNDIVKAFEYNKNNYVILKDEDYQDEYRLSPMQWIEEQATKGRHKVKRKKKITIESQKGNIIGFADLLNTWLSRKKRLNQPDQLIFDLDPGDDVAWKDVIVAAQLLHDILQEKGYETYPKLTGESGIHVVASIKPTKEFSEIKAFAKA